VVILSLKTTPAVAEPDAAKPISNLGKTSCYIYLTFIGLNAI
jgi:hypothetical protein